MSVSEFPYPPLPLAPLTNSSNMHTLNVKILHEYAEHCCVKDKHASHSVTGGRRRGKDVHKLQGIAFFVAQPQRREHKQQQHNFNSSFLQNNMTIIYKRAYKLNYGHTKVDVNIRYTCINFVCLNDLNSHLNLHHHHSPSCMTDF